MLATLLLCTPVALACAPASSSSVGVSSIAASTGDPTVTWEAPGRYIQGMSYEVSVSIQIPGDGAPVAHWLLTPAAFTVDGKPVTDRKGSDVIKMAPGTVLSLTFDLGPAISSSKAFDGNDFVLGFAKEYIETEPLNVKVAKAAPKGLDFMTMPVEELGKYQAVLSTNRGEIVAEFWPEAAPKHVRNYLDLCYTGFYDGLTFHRVIPGFMIQGGDPTGTGSGNGPRTLEAEFSTDDKYKHVPGVLSMARSTDPNSASCQFFVMHKNSPHLDGQYSAFGTLVDGLDVVEKIVNSPRGRNDKPNEKQYIKKAVIIVAN